jgi:hypothetical protein
MSAPGIRALNVARILQVQVPGAEVTLPSLTGQALPGNLSMSRTSTRLLPRMVLDHDVIVAQYVRASSIPFLRGKRVVLDFFANFIAEWLELWAEWPDDPIRDANMEANRRYLNLQLSLADMVLAANERQRDLWLGALAAIGRVTPAVYDADPTLRSLIDVARLASGRSRPWRSQVIKGVCGHRRTTSSDLEQRHPHWYDPALFQAIAWLAVRLT